MDDSLEGTKKRRYAKLNVEMDKLSENLLTLQKNVEIAANQVPAMRKLGAIHASVMVASNKVMNESISKYQPNEISPGSFKSHHSHQ